MPIEDYLEFSTPDSLAHWKVYVGLGANSGSPLDNLRAAAKELARLSTTPAKGSRVWESEPMDCPPGSPSFMNAVICLTLPMRVGPGYLLNFLQNLEKRFGREQLTTRNAPRPLDLDVLCFGWIVCRMPELQVPHPRALVRRFVLGPLAELAPALVLPGLEKPVIDLLHDLPPRPAARPLPIYLLQD